MTRLFLASPLLIGLACGQTTETVAPSAPEPPSVPEPPQAPAEPTNVRPSQGELIGWSWDSIRGIEFPSDFLIPLGHDAVEWIWDPVEGATGYTGWLIHEDTGERQSFAVEEPRVLHKGLSPGDTVAIFVRSVTETAGGRAESPEVGRFTAHLEPPVVVDLAVDGFLDMYAFNASDWKDGKGELFSHLRLHTRRPQLGRISPRLSEEIRAHIEDTFDDFVDAFTGGLLPPGGPKVDVLTFHPDEGVSDGCIGYCGCAGRSRVYLDEGGTIGVGVNAGRPCADLHPLVDVWAHELGHVMGFSHVYRGNHHSVLGRGAEQPTSLDRLHGRVAYCLGDGTPRADALDPKTQAHCYLSLMSRGDLHQFARAKGWSPPSDTVVRPCRWRSPR